MNRSGYSAGGAFDVSHNGSKDAFATKLYTGAAVTEPDITVTPLTVPFGDVLIGSFADQTVTVKNDGDADLTIGQITAPGASFQEAILLYMFGKYIPHNGRFFIF